MIEKEKWYIRFLKWLGIIKEIEPNEEEEKLIKLSMCKSAREHNVCPNECEKCAWNF